MTNGKHPFKLAQFIITRGHSSWKDLGPDQQVSTFRDAVDNLKKVDDIPSRYEEQLEEAKSILQSGMGRGVNDGDRRAALYEANETLEEIDWSPHSDEDSV